MICLKIHIFAVAETTREEPSLLPICCDLLKNSYICSSWNNVGSAVAAIGMVVICLKIHIFAVAETTVLYRDRYGDALWFA